MKIKQLLLVVAVSAFSAVGSVWIYGKYAGNQSTYTQSGEVKIPANYTGYFDNVGGISDPVDFTKAATAAVPAVVHIKTKIPAKNASNSLPRNRGNSMEDWFEQFFYNGPQSQREQRASGSGVIISEDGYIVTNNHVVSNSSGGVAEEIMVTLSNKKTYKAKVIGKDPSTDIAVLKIDGKGFPFLLYGNSDNVKLGQWVLAVGYPLTLETTVTAGIVSAKGRKIDINIRQSQTPIESFIQTDAAVNQGNSGGALISTDGQLIGINSAILAPSGTYAGYSFAIPVNLAKKIVNDLIKFGDVKQPYLGVSIDQVKSEGSDGVYIAEVAKDGAAAEIGIKKGDVITKLNDISINTYPELLATVSSYNTGDKVKITYKRDGKEYSALATLNSKKGTYEGVTTTIGQTLGADLETLEKKKAEQYEISGGVLVKKIKSDGHFSKTRMQEGFIITSVNGMDVTSIEELGRALSQIQGTIQLEGIYPGYEGIYRYPLNIEE